MNLQRKQLRTKQGFTLVEILLVVVILGVLSGLAMPNMYKSYEKLKLKKAVGDISYLMRYAQNCAIVQGAVHQLKFNGKFSQYWLTKAGNSGRCSKLFSVPGHVEIKADTDLIDFNPDGTMERVKINICLTGNCYGISTKEQKGYVRVVGPVKNY